MWGARVVLALGVTLVCLQHVAAVAVMSVDLGSQWMKVAVVSVSNNMIDINDYFW